MVLAHAEFPLAQPLCLKLAAITWSRLICLMIRIVFGLAGLPLPFRNLYRSLPCQSQCWRYFQSATLASEWLAGTTDRKATLAKTKGTFFTCAQPCDNCLALDLCSLGIFSVAKTSRAEDVG